LAFFESIWGKPKTARVVDCPSGLFVQNAYPVCVIQLESNLAMSFETRFHSQESKTLFLTPLSWTVHAGETFNIGEHNITMNTL